MRCKLDWDHLRSLQKTTVMRRTVKQASGPSSTWYGESQSSMEFAGLWLVFPVAVHPGSPATNSIACTCFGTAVHPCRSSNAHL